MNTILEILEDRISAVLVKISGQEKAPAIVRPATDARFGDYQANGVMGVAKKLKTNPRQLAEQVVGALDLDDMCETPEIAGPGFINLRLKADFVGAGVLVMAGDPERLGVGSAESPDTVVVDFSSPNVAKQMHVGHLRSTILGDSIARMLEFQGHNVIRQNHIGDWGTQFGMLIAYLKEQVDATRTDSHIDDLEQFYRSAKQRFDEDAAFADTARKAVVGLQAHEPDSVAIWQKIVDESRRHYQPIYDQLGVKLTQADECGESFYNDRLPMVVGDLKEQGLALESDGAVCVFPDGFKNKQDDPMPFIIQKSDGGYLYATTDLAALRYRVSELKAERLVYVTDARQKLHFEMLFAVVRSVDWAGDAELSHVMFGTVLGDDGTPLKTRSGENVKLQSLLDEAVDRARIVVEEKNPELTDELKHAIATAVGIGAVKYADYSNNRTSDYVFSFDKMLAMEGNTAPYMQYAYARVQSIGRKAQDKGVDVNAELKGVKVLRLTDTEELDLAKHLVRYGEAVDMAVADYRPNFLTTYLFECAQKFSSFYTSCPVLGAQGETRASRLLLCDVTARVIKHGLHELLGIEVVEQM
ncbi:arginine--tRNA ligase [Planctomycetota bacterium]